VITNSGACLCAAGTIRSRGLHQAFLMSCVAVREPAHAVFSRNRSGFEKRPPKRCTISATSSSVGLLASPSPCWALERRVPIEASLSFRLRSSARSEKNFAMDWSECQPGILSGSEDSSTKNNAPRLRPCAVLATKYHRSSIEKRSAIVRPKDLHVGGESSAQPLGDFEVMLRAQTT